jgi:Xaa-Pro dipeptidase
MVLTPEEVIKYRELGKLCAAAVEAAVREAMPGETEEEIAVNLKKKCIGCGISPDCVLVGADERILHYRHPVPSRNRLKKMLMVVLGGEKYGLNISMTRFAAFGSVSPETEETFQKNARIFAFMQTGMQDGMPYAEYFEKLQQAYADEGYPDGWKGHHQGGPTGYACREFVIKPDTAGSIRKNQAYAWNPTLPGSKFEETTFLTDQGTECFTNSGNWPRYTAASSCGSFSVADILRR